MQIKLIFTRKVLHLVSFWKWGVLEDGVAYSTRHLCYPTQSNGQLQNGQYGVIIELDNQKHLMIIKTVEAVYKFWPTFVQSIRLLFLTLLYKLVWVAKSVWEIYWN